MSVNLSNLGAYDKRLDTMSLREIFDECKAHLLKQNKQSKDPNSGRCLYRGPNGLKCAAGIFIKDEDYKREFEGKPFRWYTICGGSKGLKVDKMELVWKLQIIHDDYKPVDWLKKLDELEKNTFPE